jgi:hypothetical protein
VEDFSTGEGGGFFSRRAQEKAPRGAEKRASDLRRRVTGYETPAVLTGP